MKTINDIFETLDLFYANIHLNKKIRKDKNMKRVQFYGSTNKNFIYLLPSILIVNFVNQWQIQLSWLVFNLDITLMKKGW